MADGIHSRELADHLFRLANLLESEALRLKAMHFPGDDYGTVQRVESEIAEVRELAADLDVWKEFINVPKRYIPPTVMPK